MSISYNKNFEDKNISNKVLLSKLSNSINNQYSVKKLKHDNSNQENNQYDNNTFSNLDLTNRIENLMKSSDIENVLNAIKITNSIFLSNYDNKIDKTFLFMLRPNHYNISDLVLPNIELYHKFITSNNFTSSDFPPRNFRKAEECLCYASFSLDLNALKFLLYDYGIPLHLKSNHTALHCLALSHVMIGQNTKSVVILKIREQEKWLSDYYSPTNFINGSTLIGSDIINSETGIFRNITRWLIRFGVNICADDIEGYTALHHASKGGLLSIVEAIIDDSNSNPTYWQNNNITEFINRKDPLGRTALSYAVMFGHIKLAILLYRNGGDLDIKDIYGVSTRDVISAAGLINSTDALNNFNIIQKPIKSISINKRRSEDKLWGTGEWGKERLQGYENDYDCGIDQYEANEINGSEIFNNYLARNIPVLIRGLINHWQIKDLYSVSNLTSIFGNITFDVSNIPYANYFGGQKVKMNLSDYISNVRNHGIVGGSRPWYIFKAFEIPKQSEEVTSLVPYKFCKTPEKILNSFKEFHPDSSLDS